MASLEGLVIWDVAVVSELPGQLRLFHFCCTQQTVGSSQSSFLMWHSASLFKVAGAGVPSSRGLQCFWHGVQCPLKGNASCSLIYKQMSGTMTVLSIKSKAIFRNFPAFPQHAVSYTGLSFQSSLSQPIACQPCTNCRSNHTVP